MNIFNQPKEYIEKFLSDAGMTMDELIEIEKLEQERKKREAEMAANGWDGVMEGVNPESEGMMTQDPGFEVLDD